MKKSGDKLGNRPVIIEGHINPPGQYKAVDPDPIPPHIYDPIGVITVQGWVAACKRYAFELSNVDYVKHISPKVGDVVLEISKLFRHAVSAVTGDMITVGTIVKITPDTIENSENPDVGTKIILPNGEYEIWHNAMFLVLPDELLYIYLHHVFAK